MSKLISPISSGDEPVEYVGDEEQYENEQVSTRPNNANIRIRKHDDGPLRFKRKSAISEMRF